MLHRALRIIEREGLGSFIKKMLAFIDYKTGIVSLVLLPYIKLVLRRYRDADSLVELLFSDSLLGLLFRPSQVKEEILELLKMLNQFKPRHILEIGTALGGTLLLWTRIASNDATIISVDLPGGPFGGGYPWLRTFIYKVFARDRQRVVLIRGDSHSYETLSKIRQILGDTEIDFLFIDGDHSYEGVKKDFEIYSPLVREGGIIALHDIVPGPEELVGGVPIFWNEVKQGLKDRSNIRVLEVVKDWNQGGYGIGVVKFYEV